MVVTPIEASLAGLPILAIVFALPLYILVLALLTFYVSSLLLAFFRRLVVPLFRRISFSAILTLTRSAACWMMLRLRALLRKISSSR